MTARRQGLVITIATEDGEIYDHFTLSGIHGELLDGDKEPVQVLDAIEEALEWANAREPDRRLSRHHVGEQPDAAVLVVMKLWERFGCSVEDVEPCRVAINQLACIDQRLESGPMRNAVIRVLQENQITFNQFRMMDEAPGWFGYRTEWHWKLRHTRNNHADHLARLWTEGEER
jgi:hypothetical protein